MKKCAYIEWNTAVKYFTVTDLKAEKNKDQEYTSYIKAENMNI